VNSALEPDGSCAPLTWHASSASSAPAARTAWRSSWAFITSANRHLKDAAAVRAGVVNVARWIREQGFQNVLLEIANEYLIEALLTAPDSQPRNPGRAHPTASPDRARLLSRPAATVTVALTQVAEAADFLLPIGTAPRWSKFPIALRF